MSADYATAVLGLLGAYDDPENATNVLVLNLSDETMAKLTALTADAAEAGVDVSVEELARAAVASLVNGLEEVGPQA